MDHERDVRRGPASRAVQTPPGGQIDLPAARTASNGTNGKHQQAPDVADGAGNANGDAAERASAVLAGHRGTTARGPAATSPAPDTPALAITVRATTATTARATASAASTVTAPTVTAPTVTTPTVTAPTVAATLAGRAAGDEPPAGRSASGPGPRPDA